jgi:hypothetical protein
VAVAHFPPDEPVELQVERDGHQVCARLGPASWSQNHPLDSRMVFVFLSLRLPALTMALLLVWRRPRDPRALVGAWLMATLATATDVPREGMAAVWRGLPGPVAAVLWIPYLSGLAFGGAITLTFFVAFPKLLVRRAWGWAVLWTPALAVLAWLSPVVVRAAADGRTGPGDLSHVLRVAPANVLYLLASVTALVLGYRRLTDANERRRVRVLVAGAVLALLGPLTVALMQSLEPSAEPLFAQAANLITVLAPLSFAYAVLRHRLFDLRLVVRAGVRHAFARRTLLALVPLLAGVLVLDLLRHGDEPLLAVLAERGTLYAALAALALVARARRDRWLEALDRRFFRASGTTRLLRGDRRY